MSYRYPGQSNTDDGRMSRTGCVVVFGLFGFLPLLALACLVVVRWLLYGVWPWK